MYGRAGASLPTGDTNQERARFIHFMLGGSHVVIAAPCCIGNLDVRDCLRGHLLAIFSFTVSDAITCTNGRRVVIGRHDSRGRGLTGESSLHARRAERRGRHDGDVDERRFHFPHIDVGCEYVELGNSRTRRPVLICVPDCRNVSIPLRDSPRDGRNGCRSLRSRPWRWCRLATRVLVSIASRTSAWITLT
jgi:hypothetical protein